MVRMMSKRNGIPQLDGDERKTGLLRFFELLDRSGWTFVWTGLLSLIMLLPFLASVTFAWKSRSLLILLLGGALGGGIAVPFLCGLLDVLLCCLRDEPHFLWQRYRTSIRRNWKASLPFGLGFGAVFAIQIFTLLYLPYSGSGLGLLLCQIISIIVSASLLLHSIPQIVLMKLSAAAILKNSVLMSIRYFPRTLLAVLIHLAYWGAALLFFPMTSIVALFTSLWLPALLGLSVLYPSLNEAFQLEDRLSKS